MPIDFEFRSFNLRYLSQPGLEVANKAIPSRNQVGRKLPPNDFKTETGAHGGFLASERVWKPLWMDQGTCPMQQNRH